VTVVGWTWRGCGCCYRSPWRGCRGGDCGGGDRGSAGASGSAPAVGTGPVGPALRGRPQKESPNETASTYRIPLKPSASCVPSLAAYGGMTARLPSRSRMPQTALYSTSEKAPTMTRAPAKLGTSRRPAAPTKSALACLPPLPGDTSVSFSPQRWSLNMTVSSPCSTGLFGVN